MPNRLFVPQNVASICGIGLAVTTLVSSCEKAVPIPTLRQVSGRPNKGTAAMPPTVSAGDGFVAYKEKIQGTQITFEMLPIPGGEFLIGSPATELSRSADEGPQRRIRIEPFFIGKYEVTWPEYEQFNKNYARLVGPNRPRISPDRLADTVVFPVPYEHWDDFDKFVLQRMGGHGEGFPAVGMSQFAAKQYTKWLSKITGRFYRLPTEAEWEYACRAGTTTPYSFGDDPRQLKDYGWFSMNSAESDDDPGYHKIGTKLPNPWGVYDMYGNVAEWCIDKYEAGFYATLNNGTSKGVEAINSPIGSRSPYPRVIRGGSYDSEASECRSASRSASSEKLNAADAELPKNVHWLTLCHSIGFRLVSPKRPATEAEMRLYWDYPDARTQEALQLTAHRQVRGLVGADAAGKSE
jgi:formylglycine-generating enzyme required for sulfatase activity